MMNERKSFAKENPAMVAAIVLPVLLVALFAMASLIPQWMVAAPRYDALFMIDSPGISGRVLVSLQGGHAQAKYNPLNANSYAIRRPTLYLFDARSQSVRAFPLDVPPMPGATDNQWLPLPLPPELTALAFDGNPTAPDGYEFKAPGLYERPTGLWLFSGGYGNDIFLAKGMRQVRITPPDAMPYFNYNGVKFIGWAAPEKATP